MSVARFARMVKRATGSLNMLIQVFSLNEYFNLPPRGRGCGRLIDCCLPRYTP